MKSVFQLFRIRREERWPALAVLVYVVVLNAMVVNHYADRFFDLVRNYHSGIPSIISSVIRC